MRDADSDLIETTSLFLGRSRPSSSSLSPQFLELLHPIWAFAQDEREKEPFRRVYGALSDTAIIGTER
jgi:hypothetical protein